MKNAWMQMHENKANFPMDPKHVLVWAREEKGHTSEVSRKQDNQESIPKHKSKHEPKMVSQSNQIMNQKW